MQEGAETRQIAQACNSEQNMGRRDIDEIEGIGTSRINPHCEVFSRSVCGEILSGAKGGKDLGELSVTWA